jgi:Zn-dependent M28 family amino/carboxypeptidase
VEVKDSDVVFVGYGIVAPEFGWDDYKGVDVRGKTIVMLINDPPVADPATGKLDPKVFGGAAMTYYGRWTYKYEIAAEKGAAACLIVHETGPAAYPFGVVVTSRSRENFEIRTPDGNAGHVAMEGWLTADAAKRLLTTAGQDFDTLKKAAAGRDFRPWRSAPRRPSRSTAPCGTSIRATSPPCCPAAIRSCATSTWSTRRTGTISAAMIA